MISNKRKKFGSFLICVMCVICLLGCIPYKGYTGEYPELFTVAINLVPNAKGVIHSETEHQPAVSLIEEDSKGRKLFGYVEEFSENAVLYLMICQSNNEEFAFYYSENNLIFTTVSNYSLRIKIGGPNVVSRIDTPLLDFTDEQIKELKENNDWGQELNLDKCVKAEIIRKVQKK